MTKMNGLKENWNVYKNLSQRNWKIKL